MTLTLSQSQLINALDKLATHLNAQDQKTLNTLKNGVNNAGRVNVAEIHQALFPYATSSSASAQLNHFLKLLKSKEEKAGIVLNYHFEGSKKAGTHTRFLYFSVPSPSLEARTEVLDATKTLVSGQLAKPYNPKPPMIPPMIVVLSFTDTEKSIIMQVLGDSIKETKFKNRVAFEYPGFSYRVLYVSADGQGQANAQACATDIVEFFGKQVHYIIVCGIGFGCKEDDGQALGDVVVSDYLFNGDAKKDYGSSVEWVGASPPASSGLLTTLRTLNTQKQADLRSNALWPKLHFGGLYSSSTLLKFKAQRKRDKVIKNTQKSDIIGGEMEGMGVHFGTTQAGLGRAVGWLLVKGISDWGYNKKDDHQQQATRNAAEVVKALLASLPAPENLATNDSAPSNDQASQLSQPPSNNPLLQPNIEVTPHFQLNQAQPVDSGRGGASNPTLIAYDDIIEWVENKALDAPPLYALLGEYGMGKTTTCQRITQHYLAKPTEGLRPVLYFDLRKVERVVQATKEAPGYIPSLQETIEDCIKNGYYSDGISVPSYTYILSLVDRGALVIWDGLDEVLSRITPSQGHIFTSHLLSIYAHSLARTGAKPKVLISCRTQFFRSIKEQNNHLTGEHRGAHHFKEFRAVELLPFTEEQIQNYLADAVKSTPVDEMLQFLKTVHNLSELSHRPFTLKLISQFLPQMVAKKNAGKSVTAASLYRLVTEEWVLRDIAKQSFKPEDKFQLVRALAGYYWQQNIRGLEAKALEDWLERWIFQQPTYTYFQKKELDILQEDLRNSTFFRRADEGQKSRFEFAHTSFYEFFLADYLAHAVLQASKLDPPDQKNAYFQWWQGTMPSDETLQFLNDVLIELSSEYPHLAQTLTQTFDLWKTNYLANASELL
ncbi:MAG: NACHT domain-containing protein, partial [Gammaproteobacteria bacterium]|nr:NACHT domain-containing protein [Gammaproteobacteria bacterium]